MAQVLGLGITHFPLLAAGDQFMSSILQMTLGDPDIPGERKDPANWPELARREWGTDQGIAAAARHRAELRAGLDRCRDALDEFHPDVVVVWGDDQYENFREEVIPAFCVLAYGDTDVEAFGVLRGPKIPNAWGLPDDYTFTMHGSPDFARRLTADVLASDVDIAYSYTPRKGIHFPHAFTNTQIFFDYDNAGAKFPYPIVPIAVNCYGQHVIARRGGFARFAEIQAGESLDPPGPSPARCFDVGRAIGRAVRAGGERVALVASSSWSHAFLNDKDWHLRPDTAADRALYEAMVAGDYGGWTKRTSREIVGAGQHEMLNWFCLLGAMSELGMDLTWSTFAQTEIFNSNKAFAIFR
jgi:Catalytic LigB subunit of aromatic ring-opening dioxygenase